MAKLAQSASTVENLTYLGFDFGSKKIGVAVGQRVTAIASPLQTIRAINQKPDWRIISQLIKEWQPGGLVVGVSRKEDGSDNLITPKIQKFCRQLEGRYQLPVFTIDEMLSTYEAKQLLFEDLGVNADKLWQVQDQLAAQLILQSWLNQEILKK
jgi:putative Holliday junction resolvase